MYTYHTYAEGEVRAFIRSIPPDQKWPVPTGGFYSLYLLWHVEARGRNVAPLSHTMFSMIAQHFLGKRRTARGTEWWPRADFQPEA